MGVAVHHPCALRITVAIADDLPVMREGLAARLGVSVKMLGTHRKNVKNKLDLHSHAGLVARAALWVRGNGGT